jgi:hypothetical protein
MDNALEKMKKRGIMTNMEQNAAELETHCFIINRKQIYNVYDF